MVEDDDNDGTGKHTIDALRVIAGIVLFPVLWIGVGVNFLGIAEQLSFLPGISREGGVMSGVVALLLTVVVLGVVIGGASTVIGGDTSTFGDGNDTPTEVNTSIPTSNSTPTPTKTTISTTTASPSKTLTATPRLSGLERFELEFRSRLEYTLENNSLTGVSPIALQYRETANRTSELWMVYWECDNAEDTKAQRVSVGNYFANAAGNFEGQKPDRLVAYGVKNLEAYNDSITHIPTSSAAAAYNRSMDPSTYTENWIERLREPTESESEIAFRMTANDSGLSKAEQAFNDHYSLEESDRGCPGVAESGSGNEPNSDQHVSSNGVTIAAESIAP